VIKFTIFDGYPDSFPPGGTEWELLHPGMTMDHLGYLPSFLHADDPRSAKEQINERYVHGGWQSTGMGKTRLTADNRLLYPGDPPLKPVAQTKLRDELIVLYPSDFVAIIQKDRSFDVARLD
jgi:hypothetical protein